MRPTRGPHRTGFRLFLNLLLLPALIALPAMIALPARAGGGNDGSQGTNKGGANEVFSVRRFLLSVGSNHGGPERETLRFADSDAQSVSRVFRDLGGVETADQIQLLDARPADLRRSLGELEERMTAAKSEGSRVELVFYYSGHSDEDGLLLEGDRLDYRELRSAVDRLPADVRIIILDSCASGAFTRLKGGARRPPFLLDTSTKVQGHAFLTSSSHDEAAQESDRLGGSFFTSALLTGLRGAADATQDHRVTLNEAYQFAYQNTLARTEGTRSGPQHPGYDIQMVGSGDLVMTDLHNLTAGLVLTEELEGRLHVRDRSDGLVVEMQKPAGRAVELGLEPGEYRVFLEHDGHYSSGAITLSDGGVRRLAEADLQPMEVADTRVRGEFGSRGPSPVPPSETGGGVVHRPLVVTLWPGMSSAGVPGGRTSAGFCFNLTVGQNHSIRGAELGSIGNWNLGEVEGTQVSGVYNLVEGSLSGLQIAGVLNRVHGPGRGVQLSGTVNSVGREYEGLQVGGLFNSVEGNSEFAQVAGLGNMVVGRVRGLQAAGIANLGREMDGQQVAGVCNMLRDPSKGNQIAGVANLAGGDHRGDQIGGVFNLARGVTGAQVAGVLNVAGGAVVGAQVSGTVNYAPGVRGLQLSVVNVCGDGSGAQIGVINVAHRVRGTQIGVLNLAGEVSGAPIGALSLVRKGRQQIAAGGSDLAPANLSVKLGNRHAYSVLALAGKSLRERDRSFGGGGLGVEIPLGIPVPRGRMFGQIEAVAYRMMEPRRSGDRNDHGLHMLNRATFGVGWQAAPRFAVVGGMAVNAFTSRRNQGGDLIGRPLWYADRKGPVSTLVWPGFFFGIQV